MIGRVIVSAFLTLALCPTSADAQYGSPVPLYPGAMPRTYDQQPLPPAAPAPDRAPFADETPPRWPPASATSPGLGAAGSPLAPPPAAPSSIDAMRSSGPAPDRVFCTQPISVHVADRDSVPERYRPFVGIWSDASWTPQLCAALVVENVAADGTATIVYAFGPMGSVPRSSGGVLHGTGIIRDGELRFQNSDGSQYAFRPLYSDLGGKLTTPQGQTYGAVFKRAL